MTKAFPEPSKALADPKELFLLYLDWYREVIARKLRGLDEGAQRSSPLPSGWTPIELLKHLVYMEQRWLHWGFAAEPVEFPWGDHDPDRERWTVGPEETLDGLLSALHAGGERTRAVVEPASLDDVGAIGGRFQADPPTLAWILFHVLQEYARHAGHLDVVRELSDGATGE